MLRFIVVFVLVQAALFGAELTPWAQQYVVVPWTGLLARLASGLIVAFDPGVVAAGKVIRSTANGFAVSIEAGCNGIEAMLVLVAGMLAYPAPWRHRAVGIAIGAVAIQSLNLLRVVSLFYLGQWNREWFEWAHLYAWQALIMLDAVIVWLLWIRHVDSRVERPPASPPPAGAAA
jgi:exosortase H (IPTLxxWG-CTERM-specific)